MYVSRLSLAQCRRDYVTHKRKKKKTKDIVGCVFVAPKPVEKKTARF
jgi:hypothetical protein